jgi:hypothetical protein
LVMMIMIMTWWLDGDLMMASWWTDDNFMIT